MNATWVRRTMLAVLATALVGAGTPAAAVLLILKVRVVSTPASPLESPVTRIEYLAFNDFESCIHAFTRARSWGGNPTIFITHNGFTRLNRRSQLQHLSTIESMSSGSIAIQQGARCLMHREPRRQQECRVDVCIQLWLMPPPPPLAPPEETAPPPQADVAPAVQIHARRAEPEPEPEAKAQAEAEAEAIRQEDEAKEARLRAHRPSARRVSDPHIDQIEQDPPRYDELPPPEQQLPHLGPEQKAEAKLPPPDAMEGKLPLPSDAQDGKQAPPGVNAPGVGVALNRPDARPAVRVYRVVQQGPVTISSLIGFGSLPSARQ